jgi:hypothetical protein
MELCKTCGAALTTKAARHRGCCDVPRADSVEEQLNFWLEHDPGQVCVNCQAHDCERRVVRV